MEKIILYGPPGCGKSFFVKMISFFVGENIQHYTAKSFIKHTSPICCNVINIEMTNYDNNYETWKDLNNRMDTHKIYDRSLCHPEKIFIIQLQSEPCNMKGLQHYFTIFELSQSKPNYSKFY